MTFLWKGAIWCDLLQFVRILIILLLCFVIRTPHHIFLVRSENEKFHIFADLNGPQTRRKPNSASKPALLRTSYFLEFFSPQWEIRLFLCYCHLSTFYLLATDCSLNNFHFESPDNKSAMVIIMVLGKTLRLPVLKISMEYDAHWFTSSLKNPYQLKCIYWFASYVYIVE